MDKIDLWKVVVFQKTDLDPAITKDNISSLESALGNIDNVEKVSVNLLSATLRVHIDLVDSATDDVASAKHLIVHIIL